MRYLYIHLSFALTNLVTFICLLLLITRVLHTIGQNSVPVLSKIFHILKFRHKIMFFTDASCSQSEQPSISPGRASPSKKPSGRTEHVDSIHFSKHTHTWGTCHVFEHWSGFWGFTGGQDAVLTHKESVKSMEKAKEEISVQCCKS